MTATLNPMCINCAKLNKSCNGTTNQVWTGCIYKVLCVTRPAP